MKKSYTTIKLYEFEDTLTDEEVKRHFKLIKEQLKRAKTIEDAPALEILFYFWRLKRKLEKYIMQKEDVTRIDYRHSKYL